MVSPSMPPATFAWKVWDAAAVRCDCGPGAAADAAPSAICDVTMTAARTRSTPAVTRRDAANGPSEIRADDRLTSSTWGPLPWFCGGCHRQSVVRRQERRPGETPAVYAPGQPAPRAGPEKT